MEYAAALEEKTHAQDESILELESSMYGQIVLTKATKYAARPVIEGGKNKDLKDLSVMMKQLTASVNAQAETLVALSVKKNSGGGSGKKNTEMKKEPPGLHVCAHCKRKVYSKDENCLEVAVNKAKRYTGWTSVLE